MSLPIDLSQPALWGSMLRYSAITADPTIVAADQRIVYSCSGASFAVTAASAATLGAGFTFSVKHNGTSGTQVYTVTADGSETFDSSGTTTYVLNKNGDSATFISDGTNWVVLNESGRIASGQFSRDTSAAGADVAYTGVGFKPKGIIFMALQNSADEMSIGFDTKVALSAMYDGNALSANVWANAGTTISIYPLEGSSTVQSAIVKTFDADGFTLTWTKTGSPTGTALVNYIAFR